MLSDHPLAHLPPASHGIDLRIGVPDILDQGHGTALVREHNEELLPDHRLFASDHTHPYHLDGTSFNFVQKFVIDGKWDVQEFSKLNRSLSDVYALSRSVDSFEDQNVAIPAKREIMESFIKPWRGGGSYLSFFAEISRSGGRASKPEVDAIQWASPGYMAFLGDADSFAKIRDLLEH